MMHGNIAVAWHWDQCSFIYNTMTFGIGGYNNGTDIGNWNVVT